MSMSLDDESWSIRAVSWSPAEDCALILPVEKRVARFRPVSFVERRLFRLNIRIRHRCGSLCRAWSALSSLCAFVARRAVGVGRRKQRSHGHARRFDCRAIPRCPPLGLDAPLGKLRVCKLRNVYRDMTNRHFCIICTLTLTVPTI